MKKNQKTKMEIDGHWWYQQTIGILTQCIEDLVYAYEKKHFTDEELKEIDFKARELGEMIPSWDDVHRKSKATHIKCY